MKKVIQPVLLTFLCMTFWSVCGNMLQTPQDSLTSESLKNIKFTEEFMKDYKNSFLKDAAANSIFNEKGNMNIEFDSTTTSKYLEAYQGFFQNSIMNYDHSQKVFKWQLTSSKLIFITVIILVMSGIVFSGLQFKKGTYNSKTELQFSQDGFKISSSILGVIILVISLAFFYLYLVYVYPIEVVV